MRPCSSQSHTRSLVRVASLVALIALVIQSILAIPVCAGVLDDAKEMLAELVERATLIRESISRSTQREDEISGVLRATENDLEKEQRELKELTDRASKLQSEIFALEEVLVQQEGEARQLASSLEDTIESIEAQLRYLQRHARAEDFLPFFAAESLTESAITARSLDHVLRVTEQLAAEYSDRLNRLQDQREGLQRTMAELEAKERELRGIREQRETKVTALKDSIESARAALEQARGETAGLEGALDQIEKRSAELQELIEQEELEVAERERRARAGWTGSFLWPVSGRVVQAGLVSSGYDGTYPGIDIEVEGSTTVIAAKSGQVSHSGWIDGYGATIVINHGSGYSTIYSHCHSLTVAAGDFVIAGEVIAEVSPVVGSGASLHFEIRKDGLPLETLEYLENK